MTSSPVGWIVAALGAVVGLGSLALAATVGPPIALAVVAVVLMLTVAVLALVRNPAIALGLPLVAAPVGLLAVPGVAGLQVVHLATLTAVVIVYAGALAGKVPFDPPLALGWGLVFVAALFASSMVSSHPMASLSVSVNHLLGVSLAIAAAVVVRGSAGSLVWLLRGWSVAAVVMIAPALPSAAAATDRFGGSLVEGRVQGVFDQPNDFGEFGMLGAVASAALLAAAVTRLDRWMGAFGLVVGLAGVAVSFSRGTWLGLAGGLLVAALLSKQLRHWILLTGAAVAGVVVAGSVAGIAPFPALLSRFLGLAEGASNPEDDRAVVYAHALTEFQQHPWFGIGPGGFEVSTYDPGSELILRTYIHAHNILLAIAVEVGIFGVLAMLALTVTLGVSALHARSLLLAGRDERAVTILAILSAGLVAMAFHGLIDVVYTNPLLIPLIWLLGGIVAGLAARAVDFGGRAGATVAEPVLAEPGVAEPGVAVPSDAARAMPVGAR